MKIRRGFVSNSSTSSFLLYGTSVDECEFEEAFLKDKKEELNVIEESEDQDDQEEIEEEEFYATEVLEELFKGKNIDIEFPDYNDGLLYIGRSWGKVKDNQTGREFKKEVEEIIKSVLGDKIKKMKFGTHEAAWRD